eukprot:TRINITY_DN11230_c0_g1_i1.p1 TRINITY_DN11230_c0_g1~~TRINITY_DN11230_c0_g1_i1.p1  ORF type:complete len:454 (-),score=65.12 TRINITY_DN11230_c0_g1_i1:205-1566(-)
MASNATKTEASIAALSQGARASLECLRTAFPTAPVVELVRFAQARSKSTKDAVSMYKAYLSWREGEGRPENLAKAHADLPEGVFSDVLSHRPARDGSGVLFMEAARPDFSLLPKETYLHGLCHVMDTALPRDKDGQLTVMIDVRAGQGWANPPPNKMLPFLKCVASTLSSMYPERLRRVIVYPVPWAAGVLVSMAKKLMDPNTRSKLCIVTGNDKSLDCPAEGLSEHVSIDCLPRYAWARHKSLQMATASSVGAATPPFREGDDEDCSERREDPPLISATSQPAGDSDSDAFFSADEGGEDSGPARPCRVRTSTDGGVELSKAEALGASARHVASPHKASTSTTAFGASAASVSTTSPCSSPTGVETEEATARLVVSPSKGGSDIADDLEVGLHAKHKKPPSRHGEEQVHLVVAEEDGDEEALRQQVRRGCFRACVRKLCGSLRCGSSARSWD